MADQKDEWDDLMGEIESEKSAQKKRAAMDAAADDILKAAEKTADCLLYTSPSPRD